MVDSTLFRFYNISIRVVQICGVVVTLAINGSGLSVRAGFGAQNCQSALNLNRSTKLQICTSPRLTQNPCYKPFFFLSSSSIIIFRSRKALMSFVYVSLFSFSPCSIIVMPFLKKSFAISGWSFSR